MHRRTKIVATLGPDSGQPQVISQLIDAGADTFRINFSHGHQQDHLLRIEAIRSVAASKNAYVAILGDLQGPKIRLGELPGGSVQIDNGEEVVLSTQENPPAGVLPVDYAQLPASVVAGDTLLLDDGLMRLEVLAVEEQDIRCQVVMGGDLKSRKGLNRLGGGLSAPALTEKDYADLAFAVEHNLDYIAVSFPSCREDIEEVQAKLREYEADIHVIAKIERAEAVANDAVLEGIIEASNGVMVARGDLGVEVGNPQLIAIQKKIIKFARQGNKPVITATQMMESMVSSPVPTRAEVFDVANAVIDRTDAVMLSAETAVGAYPVETVTAMADTALEVEKEPSVKKSSYRLDRKFDNVQETVAMATIYAANQLNGVVATICLTESGGSALLQSRLSSGKPIYGISRNLRTCNRMALYRGVLPLQADLTMHTDPQEKALELIASKGWIKQGERVIVTCGDISGASGATNTMKVLEYSGQENLVG